VLSGDFSRTPWINVRDAAWPAGLPKRVSSASLSAPVTPGKHRKYQGLFDTTCRSKAAIPVDSDAGDATIPREILLQTAGPQSAEFAIGAPHPIAHCEVNVTASLPRANTVRPGNRVQRV